MTEYHIVFANVTPSAVNIKADKINLGSRMLWFFDADDHLIGCYQWDQLVGFDVVGSAAEQVITERLLHENRESADPDRNRAIEQRGLVIVLLEEALAALKRSTDEIRSRWFKIDDQVKNKAQMELLIQQQEDTLRRLQAGLIDGNTDLQKVLGLIQLEFKEMGLPVPRMPTASELAPMPGSQLENLPKKKWFS